MGSYQLTKIALADLSEIWSFIARANVDAAERVREAILGTCESLSRFPLQGVERRDYTRLPLRFGIVTRYPKYVVVYRPDSKPIEIVRILHGMRDLSRLL